MNASLKQSLKEGKVTLSQIDQACRRILEAKYQMGLFTNPYKNYNPDKAARVTLTEANKAVARTAARKSVVLLENKSNVLPLKTNTRIALIGPFANNQREMFSSWVIAGDAKSTVTIYEGLKARNADVLYAEGSYNPENETSHFAKRNVLF